ncbi:MAG: sugar diacid utilization regulator [Actinobacteria bacterium 13_2_20CM_2_71_6]|nr:MAG: sugar diacid utilization regulator [Actinobacteria bacterium 13_2_20CM_2_71_6]
MDVSAAAPVLTSALAQEIAGDTSSIIGFNVLITDRDGTVIGSGDRSRVGTFHEASVEVMSTLRPAAHSAAQARNLRGVRPGITLPIVLGATALGTVGITGSPSQVRRFGLVVKRQTEILLQESVLLRSRLLRERALEDLVRDIAYFDADVVEPDLITYRAAELGYDLTAPRVAVVVGLVTPPDPGEATARLALLQTLRATFTGTHDIVAAMPSDRFVVLHRIPPARHGEGRGDDLPALSRRAVEEIGRRYRLTAAAGIGDVATTVVELHESYQDASIALRLGARLGTHGNVPPTVSSIDDLRIHQLLAAVGHRPRTRLVEALTAKLRAQPDWPVLRQTLIAWCETGFNLVHAATALHIHRNTLVYRLNKIAQLTGKPVRDHRAAVALYLACLTDQLDDDTGVPPPPTATAGGPA